MLKLNDNDYGEGGCRMSRRYLTKAEENAILAALRLMQEVRSERNGDLPVDILEVLEDGLNKDEREDLDDNFYEVIDQLCEAINFDEVQFIPIVED